MPLDSSPHSEAMPNAIEAEQSVLGALLTNNKVADRLGSLSEDHFYDPMHGIVFAECLRRIGEGSVASPITMKEWFNGISGTDNIGGAGYLLRCADAAITVFDTPSYAREIIDSHARRTILSACETASALASSGADPMAIASALDTTVLGLDYGQSKGNMRLPQTAVSAVARVMEAYKADGRPVGMMTGLRDLDRITRGFRRGNLVVVAGRPGMGKSALAASLAQTISTECHPFIEEKRCGVILISLEMGDDEYFLRITSDQMRRNGQAIPYSDFNQGFIDTRDRNEEREERQMMEFVHAARRAENLPISIAALPSGSTMQLILSEIRRRAAMLDDDGAPVGMIVVDHLGLIARPKGRDNEASRVGELTRTLKGLARRLECVVVLLSQLNRAVEQRENKRPMLSDLRDSGSIEQDADVVLFPYRPEYYIAKDEPPESDPVAQEQWRSELDQWKGLAEIAVAKNRSGPEGRAVVYCDIACNYFSDLARSPNGEEGGIL